MGIVFGCGQFHWTQDVFFEKARIGSLGHLLDQHSQQDIACVAVSVASSRLKKQRLVGNEADEIFGSSPGSIQPAAGGRSQVIT